LEEAQELCGRIAMLKLGKVVALDHTANLLKTFAGARMTLRLTGGQLPATLAERIVPVNGQAPDRLTFRLDSYADVEPVLRQLREGQCGIDELEVNHADLEDVFIRTMQGVAS
jgi:ABC-2 type transport system ATP-binding protein